MSLLPSRTPACTPACARARGLSMALALSLNLTSWACAAASPTDFLDPAQAFQLHVQPLTPQRLRVSYDIAPGYYMYREPFRVEISNASVAAIAVPAGQLKFDANFGRDVETFRSRFEATVDLQRAADAKVEVRVTAQGCADAGLCYAPFTQTVALEAPSVSTVAAPKPVADDPLARVRWLAAALLASGTAWALRSARTRR